MKKNKNFIGLALLAVGFLYCLYLHFQAVIQLRPRGKSSILIAHWQGERGCKESLQKVIDEYNKLHPDTLVRQQVIVGMGSSFVRWCVTQIIGGTPPDIMEYHQGFRSYLSNYFLPLGRYVNVPNQYNQGTAFEAVPWKNTFYGGMYANWDSELMDYYSVPNTLYTQRIFYNKELFRKATGSDKPPQTMQEFIDICKQLEKLKVIPVIVENAQGKQGVFFFKIMMSQLGWMFERQLDFNHDGLIDPPELMRAFYLNNFKFTNPRFEVAFKLLGKFSATWGKGFNAIDKTVAPFMFIQQKGACYLGGSWLGRQMIDSCKFELGYFPIPLITAKDPTAGKYYCGPWGENRTSPGMALAVAKGPNQDIAVDFLRFLTTKKNNAAFNAGPAWVPGVIGASINPAVKAFKPLIRGRQLGVGLNTNAVQIELRRIMQNFLSKDITQDAALADLTKTYRKYGFEDNQRNGRNAMRRLQRIEERRYNVMELLTQHPSTAQRQAIRKPITNIYEIQLYGLNVIYTIFGVSSKMEQ